MEECQNLKKDLINARQEEQDSEDVSADVEHSREINTDDENDLDEAEKFRDYILGDEGEENTKIEKDEEEEEEEEEGDLKMILVSGSRENVIFFWDHESGVAVDKIMLASNQSSSKRLCPGIFITAAWVNPTKIVANSVSGHVYEWNLSFFYRGSMVR